MISRGGYRIFSIYGKLAAIFSDVGGPTMVGSDAPEKILKIDPPRLAKNASFCGRNGTIKRVKYLDFGAEKNY